MKKFLAAVALSAGVIGYAHASTFVVGNNPSPVVVTDAYLNSVGNDFVGANGLTAAGYTRFCTSCTLAVTGGGTIAVFDVGSESSDHNGLYANNLQLAFENDGAGRFDYGTFPIGIFAAARAGTQAEINAQLSALNFRVNFAALPSQNAAIGTPGFGIFYNPNDLSQVILAFDDHGATPEDNHDDFLVRVAFVPEPATWGLMILGFAGLAWTRRRAVKRADA